MKKEELIKEVGKLQEKNDVWAREDKRVRSELSKVLRYQDYSSSLGSYSRDADPMTWIQIAFAIGELRADANYSMLLQSREDMSREIAELKNPPPKST